MKIGYSVWLQWVLVTIVGFLLSLYWVEVGERADIRAVEGAVGGVLIGLAQWLVLRQQFSQAWWWVLASSVSWGLIGGSGLGALGWVAPTVMHIPIRVVYGIVNGALMGAFIGVGQWLVIRTQFKRAWRWILISTVSWALGLALGWTIGGVLRRVTGLFLGEVIGLVFVWIVVAAITGVSLNYVTGGAAPETLSGKGLTPRRM